MTEERRHELIRKIVGKVNKDKSNLIALYCLIATMTDNKLEEFYNESLNKK